MRYFSACVLRKEERKREIKSNEIERKNKEIQREIEKKGGGLYCPKAN